MVVYTRFIMAASNSTVETIVVGKLDHKKMCFPWVILVQSTCVQHIFQCSDNFFGLTINLRVIGDPTVQSLTVNMPLLATKLVKWIKWGHENVYGPVTAAKSIYEYEEDFHNHHFLSLNIAKVLWRNRLAYMIIKVSCVSTSHISILNRHNRTLKLTDSASRSEACLWQWKKAVASDASPPPIFHQNLRPHLYKYISLYVFYNLYFFLIWNSVTVHIIYLFIFINTFYKLFHIIILLHIIVIVGNANENKFYYKSNGFFFLKQEKL